MIILFGIILDEQFAHYFKNVSFLNEYVSICLSVPFIHEKNKTLQDSLFWYIFLFYLEY